MSVLVTVDSDGYRQSMVKIKLWAQSYSARGLLIVQKCNKLSLLDISFSVVSYAENQMWGTDFSKLMIKGIIPVHHLYNR